MYEIENSIGTYEILNIAGKPVYIFEKHNMAFPAWGTVASRNNQAYTLITFDHHTDTRPPFARVKATGDYDLDWISGLKLKRKDFVFQDAFQFAIEMVAYDEQIKTACKYGYLDKYCLMCTEDIRECISGAESDKYEGYDATYLNKEQMDDFIKYAQPNLMNDDLIVDFDVDYFNAEKELERDFFEQMSPLLIQADAITIAKEKWHFEALRKSLSFSHDKALEMLIDGIKVILE